MARRVFGGSRAVVTRGPRRQTVWVGLTSGTDRVNVTANSAFLLAVGTAQLLALRPFTIVRTRGTILVSTDQIAADEEPQMILGMGVFSDTAVAAGIASLPDPITNADGDWFVFEDVPFGFKKNADGNTVWSSYRFDSKAMRKVGLDEDSALVVANNSAADGGQIIVSGRVLLKLH